MLDKYYPPINPEPQTIKEMDFISRVLANNLVTDQPFPGNSNNLDWELLAEILENHRLASIFYSILSNRPEEYPKKFLSRLKQARYELLIYGDTCNLQIQDILSQFTKCNINVIVLKGWAMIPTFYSGDYGKRFCDDIDLLIEPCDFEEVETILKSLHYVGFPEVHPGYSRRFSNARAYVHSDPNANNLRAFGIGLHWGLTHYPCFDQDRIQISDLFDRAIPLKISGVEVLQLSPSDRLIYHCAHMALHHRNQETLLQYYEVASILVQLQDVICWDQIIEIASNWGYQAQLKNTLCDLTVLWPWILKENTLQALQKIEISWKERLIDGLVVRTKGNAFRSSLVQLLAMPAWKDKFSSVLQQLFPSPDYMRTRYPQGEYSLSRLYLLRFLDSIIGVIKN